MTPAIEIPHRGPQLPPPGWREEDSRLWLPPHAGRVSLDCGGSSALLGARRRSSSFDPSSFSGAQAWVDPRRADLQWTDTAGTTLSSANGDLIARIDSTLASPVRSFQQSTAGSTSRPARSDSGMAGPRRALLFTGTQKLFATSAYCPPGACTIALDFQLTAIPALGSFVVPVCANDGTNSLVVFFFFGAGYQAITWRGAYTSSGAGVGFGGTSGTTAFLDTGHHRLLIAYDGTGSSTPSAYAAWYDGAAQTVVASATVSAPTTGFALGSHTNGSLGMSGYLGRFGLWSADLRSSFASIDTYGLSPN